jgi:hypothetical protein
MADPVAPVAAPAPTTPAPAAPAAPAAPSPLAQNGTSTSEFKLAAFVAGITGVIGALTTITDLLGKAQVLFPEAPKGVGLWVGLASAAVAGLTSIAYTIQRSAIKIASIQAGADVAVAQATPAATAAANVGA